MAEADDAPPPTRSFMDDPDIEWKYGRPDFSTVDRKYMKERRMRHGADSLEKVVENLVKTWEMEITHKTRVKDWGTVDHEKFRVSANGGRTFTLEDNIEYGNYMMLMWDSPLFDKDVETNDGALQNFKTAFPGGFAWEVMEVFAGPPKVVLSWRHWADWTGPYKNIPAAGEQLEMTGLATALVTEDLKIINLQVFYDPNPLMAKLLGLEKGAQNRGTCPFHG